MTREDIIRMAREAGWIIRDDLHYMDHQTMQDALVERIERFAVLAYAAGVEAEREEIAQFLESTQLGSLPDDTALHYARLLKGFADGIRARKENT